MNTLIAVGRVALWAFAFIGFVVTGFALLCVRDSQRMKRGTK